MAYTIQFKPLAFRQLEKLPRDIQKKLATKTETLRNEPFPSGCKKMAAIPDTWRVRVGDYRIVYQVHQRVLLVLVLTVGTEKMYIGDFEFAAVNARRGRRWWGRGPFFPDSLADSSEVR